MAPLTLISMATFFTAGFGFLIGEPVAATIVGVISLAAWIAGGFLACPRRGLHLSRKVGGFFAPSLKPHPDHCVGCGRTRADVYPFQRLLAPEA